MYGLGLGVIPPTLFQALPAAPTLPTPCSSAMLRSGSWQNLELVNCVAVGCGKLSLHAPAMQSPLFTQPNVGLLGHGKF